MAIDNNLKEAIKESVSAHDQAAAVADRLIAWLDRLSDSEVAPADKKAFLENVYDALEVEVG